MGFARAQPILRVRRYCSASRHAADELSQASQNASLPSVISTHAFKSAPQRGYRMTIQRIETGARMSKAVIHGDTIYLAGFTASKALNAGVAEQTAEVLSIIDAYLAKA